MPFEQAIGVQPLRYDQDLTWPFLQLNRNPGGGFVPWASLERFEGEPQALARLQNAGTGSGVNVSAQMEVFQGLWCFRTVKTSGADGQLYGGAEFQITETDADLAPGFEQPSINRLYWIQVALALAPTTTNDPNTGLMLFNRANAADPNRWPAINLNGGFGFEGAAAGSGVAWASYDNAGVNIERVAVPLAALPDQTDWNLYEFIIINSGVGRDASVEARVNGTTIVTRNWTTAPALIGLTGTEFAWSMLTRIGNPGSMAIGPIRIRKGRFTPDGLEIPR